MPERVLSHPPITEALVDLRIATDPNFNAEILESVQQALAEAYPHVEKQREFQAEIRVEAGKIIPPTAKDTGFRGAIFRNADKTRIAQFRRDGFTLNQLQSYAGAEALIAEAMRLWGIYRTVAKPIGVTRTAMRYINKLELPYKPGDQFSRFLTAAPSMPSGAPQSVSSFLTRMVAHSPPDIVIVTQKLDVAPDQKDVPVTIDIDSFFPEEIAPERADLEAVLHRLRILKNDVFFSLLSDEAVELYK
jgi:uncharacterized protein (TIGR04255 family)